MNTSTTRAECINLALSDFIDFYEDLCKESERVNSQLKKEGGE